ncbi:MAG: hypothetical protein ACO3JL_01420 [Myxococcota bacterium]
MTRSLPLALLLALLAGCETRPSDDDGATELASVGSDRDGGSRDEPDAGGGDGVSVDAGAASDPGDRSDPHPADDDDGGTLSGDGSAPSVDTNPEDQGAEDSATDEPGPDEPAPADLSAVPAILTAILDDIPGFGAGTVGGRDGALYTVTGLHDAGPGSLREALESEEPLWIVFAPGLNGILDMQNAMRVRSFKTVDARGHDITLRATADWNGGLRIGVAGEPGVEHVVLLNLKFDGMWPNYTQDGEGDDGINIRNDTHHVWIHQCSFTNWIDGAIDAKVDAGFTLPHHITISNSFFTKTHQPLAVAIDFLTFARNHCTDVTKRCIQLNDGGRAHMVNNVIENWRAVSIVAPRDGAQLLVDHNLFKPGPDCDAVGNPLREDTDEYGRWQNEKNHWRLSWGWVAFKEASSVDGSVFSAARDTYAPVQCGPWDYDCWDALFEQVVAEAGAHP